MAFRKKKENWLVSDICYLSCRSAKYRKIMNMVCVCYYQNRNRLAPKVMPFVHYVYVFCVLYDKHIFFILTIWDWRLQAFYAWFYVCIFCVGIQQRFINTASTYKKDKKTSHFFFIHVSTFLLATFFSGIICIVVEMLLCVCFFFHCNHLLVLLPTAFASKNKGTAKLA